MNRRVVVGLAAIAVVGIVGTCAAQDVKIKGDLRYRFETREDDSSKLSDGSTYTRMLNRIRARVAVEGKANDNIKVGVALSTGQSDPVSGNQTIGDEFIKKEFRLDQAYADYNFFGDDPDELHVIGGKMKNPFITMNDDLVWDGDCTPEGLAVKGQMSLDMFTILANGGYLWLMERSKASDSMLYAAQAAVKAQFTPEIALTLGGTYYGYQNMKGFDFMDWEGKNSGYGNSSMSGSVSGTTTNKAWATDFSPLVFFAQADFWVFDRPLAVFAQIINNGDADAYETGKMFGLSYGKAKNPRTFEVGYSYAELEKDATPGFMTDSDRWGGGTDGKGHKLYAKYQIQKNLQAGITYFMDDKKISSATPTDYKRMQVDLIAAF